MPKKTKSAFEKIYQAVTDGNGLMGLVPGYNQYAQWNNSDMRKNIDSSIDSFIRGGTTSHKTSVNNGMPRLSSGYTLPEQNTDFGKNLQFPMFDANGIPISNESISAFMTTLNKSKPKGKNNNSIGSKPTTVAIQSAFVPTQNSDFNNGPLHPANGLFAQYYR